MSFIPNFAKLSTPLTKLLQNPFHFDTDCAKSFNELKEALSTTPVFIYPNFDRHIIINNRPKWIFVVLSQALIDKNLPIGYA